MNSEFAKQIVRGFQVGVAQQHFNVGAMSATPIPFPLHAEQREIVRRIEVAFSWLDQVGEEHERVSRLLPRLDQAVLAKAFRGGLVPQDPNDEPASMLLERLRTVPTAVPKRGRKVDLRGSTPRAVSDAAGLSTVTEKEEDMNKTRKDVPANYLCNIVRNSGGEIEADALWRASEMQIDEFYKLLRDDVIAKRLMESKDKRSIIYAD